MAVGKVKWFNNAKGFGFIVPEDGGEDIFAHYSTIQMEGYRSLKAGQEVTFDVQQGPKGLHAENIGVVEEPEEELEIINRINEKMFDLNISQISFEKVYADTHIIPELLKNFKKDKSAIVVVGAGNQSETAFSPKTLELLDKTGKSVIVVRNHRFSELHTRSVWNIISPRLRENKYIYRFYVEFMAVFYFTRSKSRRGKYDEKYFDSKLNR